MTHIYTVEAFGGITLGIFPTTEEACGYVEKNRLIRKRYAEIVILKWELGTDEWKTVAVMVDGKWETEEVANES